MNKNVKDFMELDINTLRIMVKAIDSERKEAKSDAHLICLFNTRNDLVRAIMHKLAA